MEEMKKIAAVMAAAALGLGVANVASAKLPAPSEEQQAKAAEAKARADDATKKDTELLGKYQDRAAENFRRGTVARTASAGAASDKR
jgi:hypothetical protein